MLTGQARNDIDKLWEKFWTGGITNPLTVIEQISYLLFARMLDMQEEVAERKAARSGAAFERIFPQGEAVVALEAFQEPVGQGTAHACARQGVSVFCQPW